MRLMGRRPRIPEAIHDLMADQRRHAWTLEEIQADLTLRGISADFSSVFRSVERLEAEGALRRVNVDHGPPRFERSAAHHDHLHCTKCDALVPVPCLARRIDLRALEAETGFTVTAHNIVLSGICAACRGIGAATA
jgi:Fur family ferric uptake transcriptional regulator